MNTSMYFQIHYSSFSVPIKPIEKFRPRPIWCSSVYLKGSQKMKLVFSFIFLSILTLNESLGYFVPLYPLHSIGTLKLKSPENQELSEEKSQDVKDNADIRKLKELIMAEIIEKAGNKGKISLINDRV